MTDQSPDTAKILRKAVFYILAEIAVFAVILFATAGTVFWLEAWVFLGIFGVVVLPAAVGMARRDPTLLDERTKPTSKDQPLWDKLVMAVMVVVFLAWFVVPGFDTVRYGWSQMPGWLKVVGAVGSALSLYLIYLTMLQNSFLAPSVKIQEERKQQVVTTGAYAIVRHPFYALMVLYFLTSSFLLGSWCAVALSGAVLVVFAVRVVGEEALLADELEGYAAYRDVTRYRLMPGIW